MGSSRASIGSCYQCGDRHPGCHGHCARYAAAKAEYERRKSALDAERKNEQEDILYRLARARRLKQIAKPRRRKQK